MNGCDSGTSAWLNMLKTAGPSRAPACTPNPVAPGEHTAHDILVDLDAEHKSELLGDPPAAKSRVPVLHLNDGGDQLPSGPFLGPGFRCCLGVKSKRYLRFTNAPWNAMIVASLSTMAERSRREGLIKPLQRPAMTRSIGRRVGALVRDRLRITTDV